MREKGFLDAEIAVDTRPTYGDRRLTLEFTITEGKTIPPSNLGCRTEVACRTVLEMILKDTSTKSGARVYVQAGFDVWRLVERWRLEPDGDAVTHVEQNGGYIIRGEGCPLSALTGKHPAVCRAMESLVKEFVGAAVHECCERAQRPRCCFEIKSKPRA